MRGDGLDHALFDGHIGKFDAEVVGDVRFLFSDLFAVDIELDLRAVGIHGDELLLPDVLRTPEMRLDMNHRLAREVGLPEIIDVFGRAPAVDPAFGVDVFERCADIFAVGSVVGIEPDGAVVLRDGFLGVARELVLPVFRAGPLTVGRFEIHVVLVVPAADRAAQVALDGHLLVGVLAELGVVRVVVGLPHGDDARGVFLDGVARVAGVVGLVAHRPDDDRGVVAVAADHLAAVLLLHLLREVLVFDIGQLLVDADAVAVHEIVDRRVVGVVRRAHVVDVEAEFHVLHVPLRDPFREGVSQPRELLVAVDAVQVGDFAVEHQPVQVVVPRDAADAEGRMIGVDQLFTHVHFAVCVVDIGRVGAPQPGLAEFGNRLVEFGDLSGVDALRGVQPFAYVPLGVGDDGVQGHLRGVGTLVLHEGPDPHGSLFLAHLRGGDERAALVFVRSLERDAHGVGDDQPHVADDTAVDRPVAGVHRRDAVFVVERVLHGHGQDVLAAEIHGVGGVHIETREAALVIAQVLAVEVYFGVFLHAVEFEADAAACVLAADVDALAVPAPAVPPVGIVRSGDVADVGMQLARGFVGLPRVGDADVAPGRVIERRGFVDAPDLLLLGEVVERPFGVDGLRQTVGA